MSLSMSNIGDRLVVNRISGREDVKRHLNDLGFTEGTVVEVIQAQGENMIINVRGSRLAITGDMARRIQGELLVA